MLAAVALQMAVLLKMTESLQMLYSECESSCTAHKAVLLSASYAWRLCTTMMQSGTALEAVAACFTCCAYKLGAVSKWQQLLTVLPKSLPGTVTISCGMSF